MSSNGVQYTTVGSTPAPSLMPAPTLNSSLPMYTTSSQISQNNGFAVSFLYWCLCLWANFGLYIDGPFLAVKSVVHTWDTITLVIGIDSQSNYKNVQLEVAQMMTFKNTTL